MAAAINNSIYLRGCSYKAIKTFNYKRFSRIAQRSSSCLSYKLYEAVPQTTLAPSNLQAWIESKYFDQENLINHILPKLKFPFSDHASLHNISVQYTSKHAKTLNLFLSFHFLSFLFTSFPSQLKMINTAQSQDWIPLSLFPFPLLQTFLN